MVVNTGFVVAFKCTQCGSFKFSDISYFRLRAKGLKKLKCRCGGSFAVAAPAGKNRILITVPCIGCGEMHEYLAGINDLNRAGEMTCRCRNSGIQHCFVGSDELVRSRVDLLENELERLMDELGYERYFTNSQVMFEAVNRLHDLAEQGKLCCRCGSNNIEIVLLEDKIYLKCRSCPGKSTILAANNKDLGKMLNNKAVLLS